jgi:hypothetical protein
MANHTSGSRSVVGGAALVLVLCLAMGAWRLGRSGHVAGEPTTSWPADAASRTDGEHLTPARARQIPVLPARPVATSDDPPAAGQSPVDFRAPLAHGPYVVTLEDWLRPGLTPAQLASKTLKIRDRFLDQYRHFVSEAGLSGEQERKLRGAFADFQIETQLARHQSGDDPVATLHELDDGNRAKFIRTASSFLSSAQVEMLTAPPLPGLPNPYYLLTMPSAMALQPVMIRSPSGGPAHFDIPAPRRP